MRKNRPKILTLLRYLLIFEISINFPIVNIFYITYIYIEVI